MTIYYVDVAVGNDANSGLSEGAGNAWASWEKAAGTVVAGDWVWVKASGTYSAQDGANDCICLIDTPGTLTAPIVFEGYYATPGDGGIVTLDASVNTLANVIRTDMGGGVAFNLFRNIVMTGATSHGFNGGSDDYMEILNCSINNNGSRGITGGNYIKVASSRVGNSGSFGIRANAYSTITNSIIYNNSDTGIFFESVCSAINVLLYGNSTRQIRAVSWFSAGSLVVDGDGVSDGIRVDQSETSNIQNTVIYDCVNGITETLDVGANASAFNNLYYSNTTDVVNFLPVADQPGSLIATSDPLVDAANRDYSLKADSEAKRAGIDTAAVQGFWDSFDAAVNPPVAGDSFMDIGAQQLEEVLATAVDVTTAHATTDALLTTIDTVVDAIKTVTDLLPNGGALTSLATSNEVTAAHVATDALLATIDTVVDAIKLVTDLLPEGGALTSLATSNEVTAAHVATDALLATIDTVVDAIKAVTDLLPDSGALNDLATLTARLTAARAGYLDKLNVSGTLAHSDDANTYKAPDFAASAEYTTLQAAVEKIRKVTTNKVVVNDSDSTVTVYEDNGTTVAFSFSISMDRRQRLPV